MLEDMGDGWVEIFDESISDGNRKDWFEGRDILVGNDFGHGRAWRNGFDAVGLTVTAGDIVQATELAFGTRRLLEDTTTEVPGLQEIDGVRWFSSPEGELAFIERSQFVALVIASGPNRDENLRVATVAQLELLTGRAAGFSELTAGAAIGRLVVLALIAVVLGVALEGIFAERRLNGMQVATSLFSVVALLGITGVLAGMAWLPEMTPSDTVVSLLVPGTFLFLLLGAVARAWPDWGLVDQLMNTSQPRVGDLPSQEAGEPAEEAAEPVLSGGWSDERFESASDPFDDVPGSGGSL